MISTSLTSLLLLLIVFTYLITSLLLFDTFRLVFLLLLSDNKSGKIVILYFNIGINLENWQLGKIIDILQALIYFVELLIELIFFPSLGHVYDLDFIIIIVRSRY